MRNRIIRLRPRDNTLYTSQGRTVLATERDGFINGGSEHGLFVHETRLLSKYRCLVDGNPPTPVALSNVEQHSWLGYYITLPPGIEAGELDRGSGQMRQESKQTLEIRLSRYVGDGVHEDIDLTNFTQQHTRFRFEIEIDADFADLVETGGERQQTGNLTRDLASELVFDYKAEHQYSNQSEKGIARIHRAVRFRIENASSPPSCEEGRIAFQVELAPHGRWHACINVIPFIDGLTLRPAYGCRSFTGAHNDYDRRREIYLNEAARFTSPHSHSLAPVVVGALEQAKHDLAALRLYDLDHGDDAWTMAAGLPIYIALFGRDTLTAGWQAALSSSGMMRGALAELAHRQGKETNDWRDEQPGRMIHEAHTGPLEVLNYNPRQRYYGSVTTSGFYPVAVSELWHWTGDKQLIRPFIEPAMKAIKWLDEYADLDGDGFYEYKTRSAHGVQNQGWKDSADAIVYEDGSEVAPPIATCEEQAFAYLAKLHLSEVLWWMDEKDTAKRLFNEASELKKRFNDAFWMDEEGFFAMGLDADKRQIKSVGSNPGHCLATAIVDEEFALKTVSRLIADDMFTGWGIRTLSSKHPAYNPYSYHRGSVWPVEHGTFALAFMRYGLDKHLELICRAQFEAAALFDFNRLPEVFSGHQRDADHPFPAYYPNACIPQAWSASAVFCMAQAMMGLYPYAPLNLLLLDPHLPEWLPEITLHNLSVGEARATIRFYRKENGESSYEVIDKRGRLYIVRQPSPWSLTATFAERLKDALMSLIK